MDGDLVLEWLSFRGYGRISDVTSSMAALTDGFLPARTRVARAYLQRLEVLGHLDLFWSENRWRIRPTILTQLPGSSALALVIGKRTAELGDRLEVEAALHKVKPPKTGTASPVDPEIYLVEYDSEAELTNVAANVGALFVPCAALSTAANLHPIAPGPRSAGPNTYGSPIEMFNVSQREFTQVQVFRRDGLFRQMVFGRWKYWLLRGSLWSSVTYSEGMCLTVSEMDNKCLQIRTFEGGQDPLGTFHVDPILPLPVQHRQALALCSGVGPAKSTSGAWTYENVPTSVALAVARSAHQHLQVH